jgi:hypothetical protein
MVTIYRRGKIEKQYIGIGTDLFIMLGTGCWTKALKPGTRKNRHPLEKEDVV